MLVFIDESGHPLPRDAATRPVILAVCVDEHQVNQLTRALYGMKRRLLAGLQLTQAEEELKAVEFLNRRSITRSSVKREFVDSVFNYIGDFDLAAFGIVMERPDTPPYRESGMLQIQYRWLFERVQRFMERERPDDMAILVFDGQDPKSNQILADCCSGFMARSDAGRAMTNIVANPLFVDSCLTPGIQIADWFAYVIRISYQEHLKQLTPSDPYLSAIKRYAKVAESKVRDYEGDDGRTWGLSSMDKSRFSYEAPPPTQSPPADATQPDV